MKKFIFLAVWALASWQASAADNKQPVDTLVVTTQPHMHCSGCENKIKQNIRFVKGVKKIQTSIPDQRVTIIYDPAKSKYEDFTAAFKKIGYEITLKKE
ncbi:MAG: heavy-metal-associated domain-containing protein [Parabacteroides sp.]